MSGKKAVQEARPQSQFFSAPQAKARILTLATHDSHAAANSSIRDVLRNRLLAKREAKEAAKARGDDDWDDAQFVQLDRETSDHVKSLIQQSDAIRRIRKERIFEDDVTEEEMDIINQRVALQQKQFAEFERREFAHKARKIRVMFGYLIDEEIKEALKEAKNDVEEAIYQFSTPGYLLKLRKEIAQRYTPLAETPQMTDVQRVKYEELLKKRTKIQKKTTTKDMRDKYRTIGRLPLDEALAQLHRHAAAKSGSGIDLNKAMKGWSEARIKAFKAIKTKPNTYYYRFNAPGEEQRTGPWTPEEQKLFHQRLAEIGANGQWGIFSMTIPGRVGYQCSNYYRYLVENRLIHDPNYVLDEKGKAHYLFTTKKKNPDGTAMRVFRKHRKPHVRMSREKYGWSSSSDREADDADDARSAASSTKGGSSAVATPAAESGGDAAASDTATRKTAKSSSAASSGAARKRKRRGRNAANSSDDDVIRANDVELSDDDEGSGNATSDGEFRVSGTRTSKRRRQGSVAARSSDWSDRGDTGTRTRRRNAGVSSSVVNTDSSAVEDNVRRRIAGGDSDSEFSGVESDEPGGVDLENPLPDLIDPITLEPVCKPAISPYGHVMGYNSWVRCLMFPPEGSQRNVCPLTKKPLSKRDLVVLTHDNIEQYRSKIANL